MTGRSGSVTAGGATFDTTASVDFLESNRSVAGYAAERQLTFPVQWFRRDGSLAPAQSLNLNP